jgi:hypothetical protein
MSIFIRTKDRVVEQVALAYLNTTLLAPYGRASELRIDSKAKRIRIHAELKGEATPLEIEITDYRIRQEGARFIVEIRGIHTSREWLTTLATNHLLNIPWELPEQAGRILARAL